MASAAVMPREALRPDDFREVIGHFASGVTVVTTVDAEGLPHGTTASAVSSLSLEPPMVLVCLNETSHTGAAVAETGRFAINILTDAQASLARQLAKKGSRKLSAVETTPGGLGLPLVTGSLAHLECEVVDDVRGGTHRVFLGAVRSAAALSGAPLTYYRGRFGRFELDSDEAISDAHERIEAAIEARTMMRLGATDRVVARADDAALDQLGALVDRDAPLAADERFFEAFVELAGSPALASAHARLRVAAPAIADSRLGEDRRMLLDACGRGDAARAREIVERHAALERELLLGAASTGVRTNERGVEA
jgi:flavin reductase (DIM6/NTAB) family NADH-FMN oxidoreductase RutF